MRLLVVVATLLMGLWASPAFAETPDPVDTGESQPLAASTTPATDSPTGKALPKAPVTQPIRGMISTGAGALGGTIGGMLGILVAAAYANNSNSSDGFAALGLAFLGAFIGYGLAMPASVYLTGYLLDGNGNIFLTVLGSWAGLALGIVALSAFVSSGIDEDYGLLLGFGVMTLLGSGGGALAFELTSDPSRRAANMQGITLAPVIAPTLDSPGVTIGLGGTF